MSTYSIYAVDNEHGPFYGAPMNEMAERVLGALRGAKDWCSGQAIGEALEISRSAVSKHIAALRALGYDIESSSRRGHRLTGAPNTPHAAEVRPLLHSARLGRTLHYVPEIDSTNDRAGQDAKEGASEGTVWVSDRQSAGRGRLQRTWHSPPGVNLYASIILRPSVAPARIPELALVAAVAIEQALRECHPLLPAEIKWPNDILVGRRKVCGVLCESEAEPDAIHYAVVGFGINVNVASFPPELAAIATSLRRELGEEVSRPRLLAAVLNAFESVYDTWLRAEDLSPFLPFLEEHSLLQGREVTVETIRRKVRGRVRGISPSGELMLARRGETVPVTSGDVKVRGW